MDKRNIKYTFMAPTNKACRSIQGTKAYSIVEYEMFKRKNNNMFHDRISMVQYIFYIL